MTRPTLEQYVNTANREEVHKVVEQFFNLTKEQSPETQQIKFIIALINNQQYAKDADKALAELPTWLNYLGMNTRDVHQTMDLVQLYTETKQPEELYRQTYDKLDKMAHNQPYQPFTGIEKAAMLMLCAMANNYEQMDTCMSALPQIIKVFILPDKTLMEILEMLNELVEEMKQTIDSVRTQKPNFSRKNKDLLLLTPIEKQT